jgi:hypothetical protein
MKFAFKLLCIVGGLIGLGEWLKRQNAPLSPAEAAAALDEFAKNKRYTSTIEVLCELSASPGPADQLLTRVGDEMRYMIWRSGRLPDEVVKHRVRQMAAELRGAQLEQGAQQVWEPQD